MRDYCQCARRRSQRRGRPLSRGAEDGRKPRENKTGSSFMLSGPVVAATSRAACGCHWRAPSVRYYYYYVVERAGNGGRREFGVAFVTEERMACVVVARRWWSVGGGGWVGGGGRAIRGHAGAAQQENRSQKPERSRGEQQKSSKQTATFAT